MNREHEDAPLCSNCDGTGESRYGEGKCLRCKGRGVIRPEAERDDDEPRQRVWSLGRWRRRAA
jgi:RecJ-like exonuclease